MHSNIPKLQRVGINISIFEYSSQIHDFKINEKRLLTTLELMITIKIILFCLINSKNNQLLNLIN